MGKLMNSEYWLTRSLSFPSSLYSAASSYRATKLYDNKILNYHLNTNLYEPLGVGQEDTTNL